MKSENDRINAVIDAFNDLAIPEMADSDMRAEDGRPLGPIDGMPIGVKANIAVAGKFWHAGIKAYAARKADDDAIVIQRLKAAGALLVGTLNMEEGALGAQTDNPWFGQTINPLKDGFTPGGSSGGSAAAVAAGFVEAALGTDTMGSVRIPSAYCGLWGFKPSHSLEMIEGVVPLSSTLDTVGVHAKSLDDCVSVMEVIQNSDLSGGTPGDVVALDWGDEVDVEPLIQDEFAKIAEGLPTTQIVPYAYGKSRRAGLILSEVEGYRAHERRLASKPDGFSDFFRGMLEYGRDLPQERIDAAYAHVKALRIADFDDFILMPTAPQLAFKFGDPVPANQADFTAFANLADRPAIAFRLGKDRRGLPASAQIVGPRGREADLIATVRAFLKL
jgi:aspartyl-tRNA(Asn)/glutamyl-tRNA(Gln) amidotransferase subunit A